MRRGWGSANRRNPRVARAIATALATWHRGVHENGRKGAHKREKRDEGRGDGVVWEVRSEDGTPSSSSLKRTACSSWWVRMCVCLCVRAWVEESGQGEGVEARGRD